MSPQGTLNERVSQRTSAAKAASWLGYIGTTKVVPFPFEINGEWFQIGKEKGTKSRLIIRAAVGRYLGGKQHSIQIQKQPRLAIGVSRMTSAFLRNQG